MIKRKVEQFKIKMVEPIRMVDKEERDLKEAVYNPFLLKAERRIH
ncbi:tryptophanase [Clostridium tetanomorphum]|nr:tryptophanase [Clostridium tetanomorphum]NRS82804.1 tryptophanase [Clostridium tetanomorphum]